MIRALFRTIAGLVFAVVSLATLAFLAAIAFVLLGTFFVTWPLTKQDGGQKIGTLLDVGIAGMVAARRLTNR